MIRLTAVAFAVMGSFAGSARADLVTINFDPGNLPAGLSAQTATTTAGTGAFVLGMNNIPGTGPATNQQLVGVTSTTTSGLTSTATFVTLGGNNFVALVNLPNINPVPPGGADPHTNTAPNGIGGVFGGNLQYPDARARAIQVTFNTPADAVTIYRDQYPTPPPPNNGTVFLDVLDTGLGVLATISIADDGPNNPLSYTSGSFNIGGIRVWSTGTGVSGPPVSAATTAFDSLSYNIRGAVGPDTGAVPEPATLAVFGLLAGVGGLVARRRKSAV